MQVPINTADTQKLKVVFRNLACGTLGSALDLDQRLAIVYQRIITRSYRLFVRQPPSFEPLRRCTLVLNNRLKRRYIGAVDRMTESAARARAGGGGVTRLRCAICYCSSWSCVELKMRIKLRLERQG